MTQPVRVAAPADAPVVAQLLIDWRDAMHRRWPPDDAISAAVERLIVRDDTEYLLGGDPPAGIVQLRYRYGVWLDAEDCHVEDVFVRTGARGSGLGRALVGAAVERARARGCRRLELDVDEDNTPARALYQSLSFRSGEERPGHRSLLMRRRVTENMPPGSS